VIGLVNLIFHREELPSMTVSNSPSLAEKVLGSRKIPKSGPIWPIATTSPSTYKFNLTSLQKHHLTQNVFNGLRSPKNRPHCP